MTANARAPASAGLKSQPNTETAKPKTGSPIAREITKTAAKVAGFASFTVLVASLAGCSKNEEPEEKHSAPKSTWTAPTVLIQPSDIPPYSTAPPPVQTTPKPTAPPEIPKPVQKSSKGCDSTMVRITNFCIDPYEVHLVDIKSGEDHPFNKVPPPKPTNLKAVSSAGVFPQAYMSQVVSEMVCRNAGKRLCSSEEWLLACSGNQGWKYPYGPTEARGTCNTNRGKHVLDIIFPEIPHMKRVGKHFNDPRLAPIYLTKSGEYGRCVSPFGVYDMDGNLSEWTGDKVAKGDGIHGVFKGETFNGGYNSGCKRGTNAHAEWYHDYSLGTRCCADVRN